ncbi:MAG: hypothetical protein HY912_02855, partial [Desulfomonile tiedjei]|nr:hypothetical protein [Desulfomonile tiedjei]
SDENTCPRCGYRAENDDDVMLVRGDCPRCGLLVKKDLAIVPESGRSEDDAEVDHYEGKIPATWERRALASLYTFSIFLGAYAGLTLIFILIFAPLDSVPELVGKRLLSAAFDAFPMFSTALIVMGICMAVPFFNGGRSWAQTKYEIHLLYTPEAQVGGLLLSLTFRVAAIMMLSFVPGMVVLWIGYTFDRFGTICATNIVTVVSTALSWAAASFYATKRPDKRSLLDLAAGTIQIEEAALSDNARRKALIPFAAAAGFWILVGVVLPYILRTVKW